ncbi:hypothetical protein [Lysobacter silvisoli]|uniref:Uncharacterized protein n=1 Tax=Lysobacter silvisoli TaxID=2293254 RepID=A0A371JWI6_9GAMM|nr:hypothetical protein [Lysobacter silvisoli]RDZ25974.1 hypothetical protein DX914_19105 [Lysobacter silvisoli]
MKEILDAGGTSFLIPVVLALVVLYAIRGLNGLHSRKYQNRKEFLEVWDNTRIQDDLWLEVTVRHLFGAYLPARVVHLALAQPNKSESLLQLSELWDLFDYDPETETVRWRRKRHATVKRRRTMWRLMFAAYFISAFAAVGSGIAAAHFGPGTFVGWVWGGFAVVCAFVALVNVWNEDGFRTSITRGDYWMNRINRTADKARKRPQGRED